jgi:hypothetical protein
MAILSLVLGLLGGVCGLLGIFTAAGILPAFIPTEEAIGPITGTTLFFWGIAVLFILGSIAVSVGQRRAPFE